MASVDEPGDIGEGFVRGLPVGVTSFCNWVTLVAQQVGQAGTHKPSSHIACRLEQTWYDEHSSINTRRERWMA